jgi:hypothetical protein
VPSALTPRGSTRAWRSRRQRWSDRLPVSCSRCGQPVQPWDAWDLDHTTPRALGGGDDTARPAHATCNRSAGATTADAVDSAGSDFWEAPGGADTPALSAIPPEDPEAIAAGPSASDSVWDRSDWLDELRIVPDGATWPRLMTGPHPDAAGSFGAEAIAFLFESQGLRLRWFQRLWLTRALEHDLSERLIWLELLLSTSRQVGKSVGMRGLGSWRLHQAPRFGEEQLVLHTGKDLPVCKEVQRPVRAWARDRRELGYAVREQNGNEEVTAPDGSRWIVRGKDSVYGYGATVGMADEAWGVPPGVVEDGLEPTMAERIDPQLVLASTAHRKATPLFPLRRAAALERLWSPGSSLLVEWSAPRGTAIDDRAGWRLASPHWSPGRERLLESRLERVMAGVSDDPDEDDPVEAFLAQYLNIWPARRTVAAKATRDEPFTADRVWADAADLTVPVPGGALVVAVEDWFGQGAAAAAAGMLGDGRVMVFGGLFAGRAEAFGWAGYLVQTHPGSRLLVGASLAGEPAAHAVGADPEPFGVAQTAAALPAVRELLAAGRLVHDGAWELAGQVKALRVAPGRAGGLSVSSSRARSDLVRAAAWAATEAVKMPAAVEFFVW